MDFLSSKRIWVDSNTYEQLDNLFQIGRGLVSREKIYHAIIREWVNNGGQVKIGKRIFEDSIRKRHCIWILVEDNLWYQFRYFCSTRELDINIGFKMAVNNFYELFDVTIDSITLIKLFLY